MTYEDLTPSERVEMDQDKLDLYALDILEADPKDIDAERLLDTLELLTRILLDCPGARVVNDHIWGPR